MISKQQNLIGIDISKEWFDASLLVIKEGMKDPVQTKRFDNNDKGLKSFTRWLGKAGVAFDKNSLVVIENTGIYHRNLWAYCTEMSLPIYIGNGADIKWSFGIARGKNDKIDSIRLCDYAYRHSDDIRPTHAFNKKLTYLKDLSAMRTKLINQANSIKVHLSELKNSNDKQIQKALEQALSSSLKGIDKSIKKIEALIADTINEDPVIKKNLALLKTVPGVGSITALALICCTNNFEMELSGKQLACYAGVVPFEHSSGRSIRGRNRVHRMANKDLKKLLHMCALTAIRNYKEFGDYYDRKKEEGKHSMSVLNAVRNKIVLRVACVINNQRPYVDKYKIAV